MKRRSNVDTDWSSELAYVIGIITTDGNLSPDGRHISITSKDAEMLQTVKRLLRLENKIGRKARGYSKEKKYFVFQFGDINFYEFLLSIGLTPAKSKTLREVLIPSRYFADFLRGCIDGDGSIGTFTHPESQYPQIRVRLVSASPAFLVYIQQSVQDLYSIEGGNIYHAKKKNVCTLSFGKKDSMKILALMYYERSLPSLKRKRKIAEGLLRASSRTGTGARLRTVWRNP